MEIFLRMILKTSYLVLLCADFMISEFSSPIPTVEECSIIKREGRKKCNDSLNKLILTKKECQKAGCCWDNTVCYSSSECAVGYYGWRCHLVCKCSNSRACERKTGSCEELCLEGYWGTGCLLSDNCTYNDPKGLFYMGHKQMSKSNEKCKDWHHHRSYTWTYFPDKVNTMQLKNYCRNPSLEPGHSAWCFIASGYTQSCDLQQCACPQGHFNRSCSDECHCRDSMEVCEEETGECLKSGCHSRWSGPACSTCADGYFGAYCENVCRCRDTREVCDKVSGRCESGCSSGWHGRNCVQECKDGFFGLNCEHSCNCMNEAEVCQKTIGHCATGCKPAYGAEGCLILLPKLAKPIKVNNRSASAVRVQWKDWRKPSQGIGRGPIKGYRVYYKLTQAQNWIQAGDTNKSIYTVSSLEMESSYQFKVTPIHISGHPGLPSNVLQTKTCGKPIGTISLLKTKTHGLRDENYTTIFVDWKAPSSDQFNCDSISKYQIYITNSTLSTNPPIQLPTPSSTDLPYNSSTPFLLHPPFSSFIFHSSRSQTKTTLGRMELYTNLYIAVSFVNNAAFESAPTFHKFIGKSSAVQALKAVSTNSSSILLTWMSPVKTNAAIEIYSLTYRATNDMGCQAKKASWSPAIDVDSDKYTHQLANLGVYSTYQVKVMPQTSVGMGKQAMISATTQPDVPIVKLNVRLLNVRTRSVNIRWSAVACRDFKGSIVGYVYEVYKTHSPGDEDGGRVAGKGGETSGGGRDAASGEGDEIPPSPLLPLFTSGYLYSSDTVKWVKKSREGQVRLDLRDLIPFVNYSVQVWVANTKLQGPKTTIKFRTQEDVPTAPRNLRVGSKSSESVFVKWDRPDPPQGVLTKYQIRYFPKIAAPSSNTMVQTNNSTMLFFNITRLKPYSACRMQVRASSSMGYGPWSGVLEEYTNESLPSEPQRLRNTSRSSNHVRLEWNPPRFLNGILKFYSVVCNTVSSSSSELPSLIDKAVNPPNHHINLTNMLPGINYECKVVAVNRVGEGPSSYIRFWTEPRINFRIPVPQLEEEARDKDNLLVLLLEPASSIQYMQEPDSLYRVVVERYDAGAFQHRPKRHKHMAFSELSTPSSLGRALQPTSIKGDGGEDKDGGLMEGEGGLGSEKEEDNGTVHEDGRELEEGVSYEFSHDMQKSFPQTLQKEQNRLQQEQQLPNYPLQSLTKPPSQTSPQMADPHLHKTPCNLNHSQLVDYATASKRGLNCYIAAEIPLISDKMEFVVGDNKTYGGYYNAKLNQKGEYDVWYGLVVTVDGVAVSSYSKTNKPRSDMDADTLVLNKESILLSTQPEHPPSSLDVLPLSGIIIGSIASILLLVLLVLLLYLITSLRKKKGASGVLVHSYFPSAAAEQKTMLLADPSELTVCSGENGRQAIPILDLWDFVVPRKQFGDDLIRAEYSEFKQDLVFTAVEALKKENRNKNRYFNIVAYDHSRVLLDQLPSNPSSSYINANFISGYKKPKAFVAAQGPTKNTIEDTWRMLWQLRCTAIVMVTNFNEAGRNKCESYWPEMGSCEYGDVCVELKSVEDFADYKIRVFSLSKDSTTRTVHQFHFTTWPDHGVPVNPTSLLEFRKKVRSYLPDTEGNSPQAPLLVHCSAGVGRTGTYITLDSVLEQARLHGVVNVYEFVKNMRNDRVNMVQTVEQYIFIYDALLEALQSSKTSTPCSEFRSRCAQLNKTNADTGKVYLLEEFQVLESTKLLYKQEKEQLEALLPQNAPKNRHSHIVPSNYSRPRISTILDDRSDYINAVYVDGYKQGDAFIATQTPLASTTTDFWAMVVDNQCGAIVSFQEEEMENSYCPAKAFHTEEGSKTSQHPQDATFSVGPFTGKLINSEPSHQFTQQEFILSCDPKICKKHRELRMKRFVVKGVDAGDGAGLPDRSVLLSLFRALEKWQQKTGNHTVVVHCRDGARFSGLFCSASYLVERLKTEHDIDVFLGVRHIRVNRHQFIPDLSQYKFLYDLLIDFLDCFDTYANFEASM